MCVCVGSPSFFLSVSSWFFPQDLLSLLLLFCSQGSFYHTEDWLLSAASGAASPQKSLTEHADLNFVLQRCIDFFFHCRQRSPQPGGGVPLSRSDRKWTVRFFLIVNVHLEVPSSEKSSSSVRQHLQFGDPWWPQKVTVWAVVFSSRGRWGRAVDWNHDFALNRFPVMFMMHKLLPSSGQ